MIDGQDQSNFHSVKKTPQMCYLKCSLGINILTNKRDVFLGEFCSRAGK